MKSGELRRVFRGPWATRTLSAGGDVARLSACRGSVLAGDTPFGDAFTSRHIQGSSPPGGAFTLLHTREQTLSLVRLLLRTPPVSRVRNGPETWQRRNRITRASFFCRLDRLVRRVCGGVCVVRCV